MDRPDQSEAHAIYARRKWSAERLEIPLNASKKEARTRWLKSLEEADFLPDEVHLPSWRIVTSEESALLARKQFPEWASCYDDAMGREIEEFARRFFKFEPAERRKEYARLINASRDNPRHQYRLSSLSSGLKLPAVKDGLDDDDEDAELMLADVEEVSNHIRSMFIAAPPVRARIQQAFLRDHAADLPRWGTAAKVLNNTHPELTKLVPAEYSELTGWDLQQRQATAFQEALEERVALQALETQRAEHSSRDSSGSFLEGLFFNRYALFVGVWILIKLVPALINSSPRTASNAPNLSNLPPANISLEEFKKRYQPQISRQQEARRWIRMEEEEFQASNGEAQVRSLGVEEKRREYRQWRARVDEHDMLLDEKIARRDELRTELSHQERLETVWKVRHQAKLEKEENPPNLTEAQKAENTLLRDELHEIQRQRLELQGQIETVQGEILRLQILLAGMKASDPSDKPLDEAP